MIYSAVLDLFRGFAMHRVWMALASEDVGDQYRRTTLGPLWLLINYLALAGIFIIIFRQNDGIPNFAAYVAIGLFVWLYLSEVVTQATPLFLREESLIKGTTLPLSVYVLRLTVQSLIRAAYALVGCIAILLVAGVAIGLGWMWAALGLILITLITPAAVIVFAIAGAFVPDVQFIINNLMRLGLFLTPVFWAPVENDSLRTIIYIWNPFTHFLEMIRIGVIDDYFPAREMIICSSIGLTIWILALLLLGRYRKKIAFVL